MSDLPRYWLESNFPRPRSPAYSHEKRTAMMTVLEGLAFTYREDPVNLSTVLAAFARIGFPPLNWDMGMSHGGISPNRFPRDAEAWGLDRCRDVANAAMRGRRRSVLTARADGLLTALEAHAETIVEQMLHDRQVEACMIECRELTPAERNARWREREAHAPSLVGR